MLRVRAVARRRGRCCRTPRRRRPPGRETKLESLSIRGTLRTVTLLRRVVDTTLRPIESRAQRGRIDSVLKRLATIDEDHRYFCTVQFFEFRIGVHVDDFEVKWLLRAHLLEYALRHVAKVATN